MDRLKTKYLLLPVAALLFLLPMLGTARPCAGRLPAADSLFVRPDSSDREKGPRFPQPGPAAGNGRNAAPQESPLPADAAPAPLPGDSLAADTTAPRKNGAFLDDIISGKNRDSLYYDLRSRTIYIYNEGDISYQNINLKGDFMRIDMDDKMILAHGKPDTLDGVPTATHPVFTEGNATPYTMDTITYNFGSRKAKIKGVATQEGDGWLIGRDVKKQQDNTIHIRGGQYTTCDHTDHPHFYLSMARAKVIPGKKVITGPTYLVLEDVPIYFPLLPEGFFPLNSGPKSGLLMPTFGEEAKRGFFLRDLGYYFAFSQHADLAIRGGIYTLGSWEVKAESHYRKRYKYSGDMHFEYSNVRVGDKGAPDFVQQNNMLIQWTHTQDPKANPGSTFSASVNFRTSGYNRYSATTLNDALQTQTNSSISYSKSWSGTPLSFSASMNASQNSQSGDLTISLPNAVFNVATTYPFKRKEAMGKAKWYEKIALRYTGKFNNRFSAKESEIFSRETFENMQYGFEHSLPVSASYNIFNYINFGPAITYNEKWYFKKVGQVWNPTTNRIDKLDPEYGFYRIYNYDFKLQATTTVYGRYEAKKPTRKLQAVRHTITPAINFSYAPDFSKQKYGFLETVQSDSLGNFKTYSPFEGGIFGSSVGGRSLALNATLSQTLEIKVLSKRDTSGLRKIKLIEDFRIGQVSYNFLADSMRLSTIPLSLRTTLFKGVGLQVSATLDPYRITPEGRRINRLFFPGRITQASTGFSYSFQSRQDRSIPAINDPSTLDPLYANPFYDPYGTMDPMLRRQYMAHAYYDFSLPWNLTLGYNVAYSISPTNNGTTGYSKTLNQTLSISGSVTILPKLGVTVTSGYDFQARKISPTSISIKRDLHCWQMSFVWIPFGNLKSWSFNIGVVASSLSDLKYDKSQSMYDNMY